MTNPKLVREQSDLGPREDPPSVVDGLDVVSKATRGNFIRRMPLVVLKSLEWRSLNLKVYL
jgi:hypothetical protein